MSLKLFSVVLISVIFLSLGINGQKPFSVRVSIYYDAYGEPSQEFLTKVVYPIYPIISKRLILDLIPYGVGEQEQIEDDWRFECESGPDGCTANIIHGCAFAETDNQTTRLEFANCIIKTGNVIADASVQKCAEQTSLPYDVIRECVNGPKGREILATNGLNTKLVRPPIYRSPTVLYNGFLIVQRSAQRNFLHTVCALISPPPEGCPNANNTTDEV